MLIAALVIAGWIAAYLGLREVLTRRCEEIRREFEDEINVLHMKIRFLDCAVAEHFAAGPAPRNAKPEEMSFQTTRQAELIAWPAPASASLASEDVSAETMAVIAETVTGFLGKRVGIRSAKRLSMTPAPAQTPSENAGPWSQHGRVLVQSSHQSVLDRTVGAAQPAPTSMSSERTRP
jgi:hypothetical protein